MSSSTLNQIEAEVTKINDFIIPIFKDITDAKDDDKKPTGSDDISNIESELQKYGEDLIETEESQIKLYGKTVTNKGLEYIIQAIDAIYPVSPTKVFNTNTKRILYRCYQDIYVKTKKYINDLSSDVNSKFYIMLKDNDFSKLGKDGFDMENFYHLYKLWFDGTDISPDKKPIGDLLTNLFKATSDDGKSKNDAIETSFTRILNVVVPDIAAIIYYGFSLDYKSGTLKQTGKLLSAASSSISTGISSLGSKFSNSLPTMVNPFTKSRVGGMNNAKKRFMTPKWVDCSNKPLVGSLTRDDVCNQEFITFLIGMLLNQNYNTEIASETDITKNGTVITDVKDFEFLNLFDYTTADSFPPYVINEHTIKIKKFSNIFLYNIWLLIIFKFILNQNDLDNIFEPKTPAVPKTPTVPGTHATEYELLIMNMTRADVINPSPGGGKPPPATDLGLYIEHTIKYIKDFNTEIIFPELEKFDQTKKKGGNLSQFTSSKYLTKKNKKMLTLKITLKKKYKNSYYLTKKIKKKFRK